MTSITITRQTLTSLRHQFRGLADTGHKQIALRAISNALTLIANNPAVAEELYWKARFELPYAQVVR